MATYTGVLAKLNQLFGLYAPLKNPNFTGDAVFTGTISGSEPENASHLTTKSYVDNRLVNYSVENMKHLLSEADSFYSCPSLYTSNKTTITIPAGLRLKINETIYTLETAKELKLGSFNLTSQAGKDIYIYACEPTSGSTTPDIILSVNSTVPTDYTKTNSRKIGGFHTECADVGDVGDDNPYSGYVLGDILPHSRWDLFHRSRITAGMEGYCYLPYYHTWAMIYLPSWDGKKLVSAFGGTIADGTSTKKWHGESFSEQMAKQGGRLLYRHEFVFAARSSLTNENRAIKGAADPTTTGGHVNTDGYRIISNYGLEDCIGVSWQFLQNLGFAGGSGFGNSTYDSSVDSKNYGQGYGTLYQLLGGGRWADGSSGGSRAVACGTSAAYVPADYAGRGAAEPLYPESCISYCNT